jgi:hypothetical protein
LYFASNSHYETDFGVSSAFGAGNTKIGFLKVRQRRTFKKPIFIMRIADDIESGFTSTASRYNIKKLEEIRYGTASCYGSNASM